MESYEQVQEAFIEAVGQPKKANEETVAEACEAVLEKATELLGAGVYVRGQLDEKEQGIRFLFKRPSVRQRFAVFVACPVDTSQKATKKSSKKVTDEDKKEPDAGLTKAD